jgi:hypothetical protein
MHGLIMVFGAIMPAFVGFANWQIPLMIGAADMAFRAHEQLQLLAAARGLMLAGSFFMPGGAPAAGWTLYAPLSVQMGPSAWTWHLRDAHHGRQLDHGLDQHHRHHPEHARARHDADEDAAVRAGPG